MDELFGQLDLLKKPVPKKKSKIGVNMRRKGTVEVNVKIVDSSDGDIDKAVQVLDNNTTSKGVWSMVSKLHKSLYDATFDDLTSSVDASKIELLKDTIANLEAKLQVIQKLESKDSAVA